MIHVIQPMEITPAESQATPQMPRLANDAQPDVAFTPTGAGMYLNYKTVPLVKMYPKLIKKSTKQ